MQTFVVIATNPANASDLERAVRTTYEGAHQDVGLGVWFVADRGVTADEVCQKLGVKRSIPTPSPGLDDVMVLKFEDYFGHASKTYWNWIVEKRGVA